MGMQQQGQQFDDPLKAKQQKKRASDKRWLIAIIALVLIAGGAIIWLRGTQGSVYAILPIVIFTVLGVVVALFQWLFPVIPPQIDIPLIPRVRDLQRSSFKLGDDHAANFTYLIEPVRNV